jgi:hypothetical protein
MTNTQRTALEYRFGIRMPVQEQQRFGKLVWDQRNTYVLEAAKAKNQVRVPLWTARPTPANMAGFGAAPPSASVE